MNFLALQGSERPVGLTSAVLDAAKAHLAERHGQLEIVCLAELDIHRCGACGDCNGLPHPCLVRDDVAGVVSKMVAADGIIYAAPAHGFGTAAQLQVFLERAGVGYLRFERPLTNKVAGVIVTGRRYSLGAVHDQLVNNIMLNRMILTGSGFPVLIDSWSGVRGECPPESVRALYGLLDRMMDMATLLRRAAAQGIELPAPAGTERS